jgi:hypothetical protein
MNTQHHISGIKPPTASRRHTVILPLIFHPFNNGILLFILLLLTTLPAHPLTCSPAHPLTRSPVHPFTGSHVRPFSPTFDTISNWDGITQSWQVYAGSYAVVENPLPDTINPSAHCMKIVTSSDPYDLMMYTMSAPADFDHFPKYRIKILAPAGNGTVTLKFQNAGNTQWEEVEMKPVPGRWTDLEFDFSGLSYNNLTRMVIFVDFEGTVAGKTWYVDDVLKEIPPPLQLQSNLPIVVISSFGVSVPDEPKITGHMGVIDNGPGNMNNLDDTYNNFDGSIGIETRGKSTQMFPKKSYNVETRDSTGGNLNVPLLGMPAENDWILYAPYSDKSMLRNAVTFDLARKMGDYHSRTRFCEVVLNDDYKGVYLLMEKIKKDKERVDIATLNPDEITGDDLTGGYILSVDWWESGMKYGIDGWKSDPVPSYPNAKDITFQFYYPEPGEIVSQQRDYIRGFVTRAENTLTSAGFSNPDEGYLKYLDAASFVEFMLVSELSKEVDKYRYSNYFFKQKDSDGGKLFAGPVWDFNLGYGNVDYWQPGINPSGWIYSSIAPYDWSIMFWWKRLMEDPYFRNLAKTRWSELRQTVWSDGAITSVIDSITGLIGAAKDRNYVRWPILGTYVWPNYNWWNNDYEDEVAYFKNFLFQRLHWIDANLPGTVLQPWASLTPGNKHIRLRLYGDYFSRPNLKAGYFHLNDAPADLRIMNVQYVNASESILNLTADAAGHPGISVTVEKKILNTWHDITSNKLSATGTGEDLAEVGIRVFAGEGQITIQCNHPEMLPKKVEILTITGQRVGEHRLEPLTSNHLQADLTPGVYFLVFHDEGQAFVQRVLITP